MKLGSTNISSVKLGSTDVTKIMLGSTEVWSAGPAVTFQRDFSGYSGGTPDDFTEFVSSGSAPTYSATSGADAVGGTWLQWAHNGSGDKWLTFDTPGANADMEILAQVKHPSTPSGSSQGAHLFLRTSQAARETIGLRVDGGGGIRFYYSILADSYENIGNVTDPDPQENEVWWIRVQVIGSALKARIWKPTDPLDPETDEPGTWTLEQSVPVLAPQGAGYAGFGTRQSMNNMLYGYIGVSTDPANTPAPYPLGEEEDEGGGEGGELERFLFTPTEFTMWQDRWTNGPYKTAGDAGSNSPAEVTRITNRKNAFMSDGVGNWPPTVPPATGTWQIDDFGDNHADINDTVDMLCAAFYAAINSDTTVRDEWVDTFDSFRQAELLDFSDRTLYPIYPAGATDMTDENPAFTWTHHMLRLLSGYEYISHVWPDTWTEQEQDDIAEWFLSYAEWVGTGVDNRFTGLWSARGIPNGSATTSNTSGESAFLQLSDSTPVTTFSINRHYNNRRGFNALGAGVIALRFGDQALVDAAVEYYRESLALYAVDGYLNENYRGTTDIPSLGLHYIAHHLGMMGVFAEYHRRVTGNPTLLDTEIGFEFDKANPGSLTAITPRSLLDLMKMMVRQMDGTDQVYRASGTVAAYNRMDGWHDTSEGGGVGNWKTVEYVVLAIPNLYYQDSDVAGLVHQTGSGLPGYPASPASDGAMSSPWGGPGQIMPSALLQFGDPPE